MSGLCPAHPRWSGGAARDKFANDLDYSKDHWYHKRKFYSYNEVISSSIDSIGCVDNMESIACNAMLMLQEFFFRLGFNFY